MDFRGKLLLTPALGAKATGVPVKVVRFNIRAQGAPVTCCVALLIVSAMFKAICISISDLQGRMWHCDLSV